MTEERKEATSPSWELFWQEHGESLLKQEEEEKIKKELRADPVEQEAFDKAIAESRLKEQAVNQETANSNKNKAKEKKTAPRKSWREKYAALDQKQRTIAVLCLCGFIFLMVAAGASFAVYEKMKSDKAEMAAMVEEKTAAIQAQNKQAFADINQRLGDMGNQVDELVTIMEDTDDAIVKSGADSREAMSKKISELDKQLSSLKKSLEIIMEDQNAR